MESTSPLGLLRSPIFRPFEEETNLSGDALAALKVKFKLLLEPPPKTAHQGGSSSKWAFLKLASVYLEPTRSIEFPPRESLRWKGFEDSLINAGPVEACRPSPLVLFPTTEADVV
ncbi:hypothetical protein M422DRAFT_260846 [Sphaerobolus stellatus SS14]|uniref:Uncharacterized protein n=1 Tax=Sphaerobolus stellatus (strain SS14) TaxID=990650 RepID=A0A0C9UPQ8_SPHS4|nr:hypothetical protein M422DRAFT_273529 [Sphaerobolus stellatus SS14]KIJ36754.1 hypothetical protein M422DRAFT_260846 [Sphaerobolus stellatus SS14]